MGRVKPEEFQRSLGSGKFEPIYLLHGEDGLSIDQALARIEQMVLGEGLSEFNADFFHGREADVSRVLAAAMTLPVMADYRLVVVRRVEELKGAGRESLIAYMGDPSRSTVLVLSGSLVLRGSGTKKEDKALEDAAARHGISVNFARPTAKALPGVIREMVKQRGKQIEGDAVETLMDLAGDDMLGLRQQIEKVILYAADQKKISREHILEAVADIKEANVFEFTDAIGARDVESALRSLRRMREQGQEALMILGMLLRHFRLIWKIQQHLEAGQSPEQIARSVKLNPWILKKSYLPQIQKFPAADMGRIARTLADLDIKIKSTRADKDILFERTVIGLCLGRLA